MSLRFPLALALIGLGFLGAPAFAMQTVAIPDSSTPDKVAPPDGLFDSSIPDTWQKKANSTDSSQSGLGRFQFSFRGGSSNSAQPSSAYDDARVPGSEFYQPLPGYSYTYGYSPPSSH